MMSSVATLVVEKPLLRGWLHALAAPFALFGLVVLILLTRHDPLKLISVTIYGVCLFLLFAVSATYHIPSWSPRLRTWWRRADHGMIFLIIAATYTPLVFNILGGPLRVVILVSIWVFALIGILGAAPFLHAHRRLFASFYLAMGWLSVIALAPLTAALGLGAAVLLAFGGLQYSLGAAFYAFRKPKLWPRVFSYHELFHAATLTAAATFFVIILVYAVPYHRP